MQGTARGIAIAVIASPPLSPRQKGGLRSPKAPDSEAPVEGGIREKIRSIKGPDRVKRGDCARFLFNGFVVLARSGNLEALSDEDERTANSWVATDHGRSSCEGLR